MRSLLDVGVLIALFDSEHIHHGAAAKWLAEYGRSGWASCPLTQNGCIRIMSQPSYRNSTPARVVAAILSDAVASAQHEFWTDSVSLLTPAMLDWEQLLSGRHLTDLYLLSLAMHHRGRLVTLDRRIPIQALNGATSGHLVVVPT